jgi:acetylornithine deacetylase/succinyl-diaminopimelate desuccinylase-like protein
MLQKVHDLIDKFFEEHLCKTQEFLRLPSISGSHSGLAETAVWLNNYLKSLGGNVQLLGKPESPILVAHLDVGKPKTLLIYGMYDVQPVEGQEWISPPFAANIQTLPEIGPVIIARGACNSKGPIMGFLNAVESIKRVDNIPVNLIFTIEGEEEIGSPTLPEFYRQNRNWLISAVDACFEPFWAEYGTDVERPVIALGSKGIVSIELICRGGAWGGPTKHSVHSSVGAWISSPGWRLLKSVNTLLDVEENILIDGFDEEIDYPTEEDERLLEELSKTFNEERTLGIIGAKRFKFDKHGKELLRSYLYSPSLQLGPLSQEEGDVIPEEARINLTVRLAPNMDPITTVDKIRKHLDRFGFNDIEIKILAYYPYSKTNFQDGVVQCLLETYRYHGVEPQIWPILASATPYYLFSEILNKPFVSGGLGKAGKSHVADEYLTIDGLRLFEKSIATFLYKFSNK